MASADSAPPANFSWAARGDKDCNQVIGYEQKVQECFPGKPAIGLCQYPVDLFSKQTLNSVLAAHKLHLLEENETSTYSSLWVGCAAHTAEIVANRIVSNPNFYYVVQQQQRPKEVIGWGVARDLVSANREVERLMKESATVN